MILYGLITEILFGFLLQKAGVIRYDKQLGALRLMDMTLVKFMLSTVPGVSHMILIPILVALIAWSRQKKPHRITSNRRTDRHINRPKIQDLH